MKWLIISPFWLKSMNLIAMLEIFGVALKVLDVHLESWVLELCTYRALKGHMLITNKNCAKREVCVKEQICIGNSIHPFTKHALYNQGSKANHFRGMQNSQNHKLSWLCWMDTGNAFLTAVMPKYAPWCHNTNSTLSYLHCDVTQGRFCIGHNSQHLLRHFPPSFTLTNIYKCEDCLVTPAKSEYLQEPPSIQVLMVLRFGVRCSREALLLVYKSTRTCLGVGS